MSTPTITGNCFKGHWSFSVDGTKVPSPSKLAPKDLTGPACKATAEWVTDHWDELARRSVTERLKLIPGYPAEWSAAADRGTACHKVMENLLNGRPASTTDPSVLGDATAAARLVEAFRLSPIASEQPVIHLEQLYAGTTDLIAESDRLGRAVFDFKFGKRPYASHAIQLACYNHATNTIERIDNLGPRGGKLKPSWLVGDMPQVRTDTAYLIHAHDGVAELIPVKTDAWVWEAVLITLDLYWGWTVRTDWDYRDKPSFDDPLGEPIPADTTMDTGDDEILF